VGSALNALTMAAGLVSMGIASVFSEAVGLRAVYAIAGLITLGAGVVGLLVLKETGDGSRGTPPRRGLGAERGCRGGRGLEVES